MTADELEEQAQRWFKQAAGDRFHVEPVDAAALMFAASVAWEQARYLRGERPLWAAPPDKAEQFERVEEWAARRKQWTEEPEGEDEHE